MIHVSGLAPFDTSFETRFDAPIQCVRNYKLLIEVQPVDFSNSIMQDVGSLYFFRKKNFLQCPVFP